MSCGVIKNFVFKIVLKLINEFQDNKRSPNKTSRKWKADFNWNWGFWVRNARDKFLIERERGLIIDGKPIKSDRKLWCEVIRVFTIAIFVLYPWETIWELF